MTTRDYIDSLNVLSESAKEVLREGFEEELDLELTDEISAWIEDKAIDMVQDCLTTYLEY